MTTVGRWSPNKVRARVLDGTWVSTEELGGMVLLTPSSIAYSGTSATIGANGSVEFSAVTSLSLNGVFTGDYDNYMVTIRLTASASTNVLCRLRVGEEDESGSYYVQQNITADSTSVTGARSGVSTDMKIADAYNTQRAGSTAYFFGPYLAQPTAMRYVGAQDYSSAAIIDRASTQSRSISYDGFTMFHGSNNISGLVSVYGLVGA